MESISYYRATTEDIPTIANPAKLAQFYSAIIEAFQDGEVYGGPSGPSSSLLQEVEKLGEDAVILKDVVFGTFGKLLKDVINTFPKKQIDRNMRISIAPQPYIDLMLDWTGYNTYPFLLQISRGTAERARDLAADFYRDFTDHLSNDAVSIAAKRQYIDSYIAKLDNEKNKTAAQSQLYVELAYNLKHIKDRWVALSKKDDLNAVRGDILPELTKLRKLVTEINSLQSILSDSVVQLDPSLKDVFGALRSISPTYFSATVVTRVMKRDHESAWKLLDLQQELYKQQRVVSQKLAACDPTSRLDIFLADDGGEYNKTLGYVHVFANLWAHIRRDVVLIRSGLDTIEDDDDKILFNMRLEAARVVYKELWTGLNKYCEIIKK